jgi:hypothetical protein
VGTGALPSALSQFVAQLDELRAGGLPDMDAIARLLTEGPEQDQYTRTPSRSRGGAGVAMPSTVVPPF